MGENTDKCIGAQSSVLPLYCINQLHFLKHRKRDAITLGVKNKLVVIFVGVFVKDVSDSSVICCEY